VDDPVAWSLENARTPLLERAKERLLKLTSADRDRTIRLVTRRCKVNLIERRPQEVFVHYWGRQGRGDLRPFFKTHRLGQQTVKVCLIDRKREISTGETGDDFRFGDRLPERWPWKTYLTKWERRNEVEPDDRMAAPGSWSGYAWEGVESNQFPWAALKSAWRHTTSPLCQNCDQPMILANFGYPWTGFSSRSARFIHFCPTCRRQFDDHSVRNVDEWLLANLDAEVRPDFIMMRNHRAKWKPRS
jgi:hypothetical protein